MPLVAFKVNPIYAARIEVDISMHSSWMGRPATVHISGREPWVGLGHLTGERKLSCRYGIHGARYVE